VAADVAAPHVQLGFAWLCMRLYMSGWLDLVAPHHRNARVLHRELLAG
jgi:hypothetical protein